MAGDAKLPTGERVRVVGHAEGPEYLDAPFGRDTVVGSPRRGEKVTQVRFEDGRREWWPARKVTKC